MRRLLRIIRLFWASSLAAELEYRFNFLLALLTSAGNFLGSLFTLSLLYQRQHAFGGWTRPEAMLVMGLFTILDGLSNTLLTPNLSRIVGHIQKGTLDFVLLKPLDTQFWLSLRNISPWGLPNLAFGMILIFYAGAQLHLGPLHYLVGLLPLLLSIMILYSLWFLLGTLTIWFVKIYNITEMLRGMTEAGRYPISAYPALWRFFFTFVVPVAFLTTVPAEAALLRRGIWSWIIAEALLASGLLVFARGFWRFALRSYTSASS